MRRTTTRASSRRWYRPGPEFYVSARSTCPTAIRPTPTSTPSSWPGWSASSPTPNGGDVYEPAAWVGDALSKPETRAKFRALANLGLVDAVRATSDAPGLYSFWDYQAGAWQRNRGLRIDHVMLSPQAADRLLGAGIDKHVRGWDRPSDHVPVVVELDLERRE